MRNLLRDVDRDRLVGLLTGGLAREVVLDGRPVPALAEGLGASLCPIAGNAVAAELLALPAIRAGAPALSDGVLDLLLAAEALPVPCRAAASGGVEVLRDDPSDFELLSPFHRFTGDLRTGVLRQAIRGADGVAALHAGLAVELRLGRHAATVAAGGAAGEVSLRREGEAVILTGAYPIRARAGWLGGREVEAATVTLRCEIPPDTPLLRLSCKVRAALAIPRLVLVTALGGTEGAGMRAAGGAGGLLTFAVPGWPEEAALHLRPVGPEPAPGLRPAGDRMLLRHGPFRLRPGEEVTLREDRLLACATPADWAAAHMARPELRGLELAPGRPEPAALTAVATALLHDAEGHYRDPLGPARRAALEAWLDRRLGAVPGDAAALAHALMAEVAWRGPGSRAAGFAASLLALQTSGGAFRAGPDAAPDLLPHALATLALARAGGLPDPSRAAAAVAGALAAMVPAPVVTLGEGRDLALDGVALDGAPPAPARRHAESLAAVARAAGAAVLAAEAGALPLAPEAVERAAELHLVAIGLLRPLVRKRGAWLEVAPSPLGGDATPESQAAVTLALLSPEAALLRLPGRAAA